MAMSEFGLDGCHEPEEEVEPPVVSSAQPPRGGPATDPDVAAVRLSFWESLVRPALFTVEETLRREAVAAKAWAAQRKFGD